MRRHFKLEGRKHNKEISSLTDGVMKSGGGSEGLGGVDVIR